MDLIPRAKRDSMARWLIGHSGVRVMTSLYEHMHSVSLYALGYGSAELPVHRSGERHVLALLERKPGNLTVFDVGAHQGAYAAMAHEQLGSRARIHCFEPDLANLDVLKGSVARLPNAVVHPFGLGAESKEVVLHGDAPGSSMASLNADSLAVVGRTAAYSSRVRLRTVADVCDELSIERVDLLKIDVEGTELDVLQGARPMLEEGRVGLIQFEFGYGNVASRTFLRDFHDLLRESHDLHRVAPRGLVPVSPYTLKQEVFVAATNYVAIRRR